jgi:hypothetical protein
MNGKVQWEFHDKNVPLNQMSSQKIVDVKIQSLIAII